MPGDKVLTTEPVGAMAVVAERLVCRASTPTKPGSPNPIHGSAGARADLEIPGNVKGAVELGLDEQGATSNRERIRGPGFGLSASPEIDGVVASIAVGLVGRGTTSAQR